MDKLPPGVLHKIHTKLSHANSARAATATKRLGPVELATMADVYSLVKDLAFVARKMDEILWQREANDLITEALSGDRAPVPSLKRCRRDALTHVRFR